MLWLALATALLLASLAIPRSGMAAAPYEIDALISMTGSAAFVGHADVQTLAALEDVVNRTGGIGGRSLKVTIHDDESNPQVAVQLFTSLLSKSPAVVFGPMLSATCGAVLPLVKTVVTYCLSPAIHPPPGSYMFSTSTDSGDQFVALLTYFTQSGLTRIVTITSSDATGQDADRGLAEAATKVKGAQVVAREHFATSDISVAAQIARITASNAQAVVAWTTGTAFGTVLRGISDAGLTLPVVTSSGNMNVGQLKQYGSIVPKDLLFAATSGLAPNVATLRAQKQAIATFDSELAKQGVTLPGSNNQTVWDPAMIVVSALRKLGPDATAAQIHDYVTNLHGWVGINGAYDFGAYSQRGIGLPAVVIIRWNPGAERWQAVSKGGGIPLAPR